MNSKITFSGISARFVCILCISMLVNFSLLSQTVEPAKIVPPSPNAASLGKFADIPVGYYTGTLVVRVVSGAQLELIDRKGFITHCCSSC